MRPVSGWKLREGSSVVTRHWMAQPLMRMFSCRRPRSGRLRPSATWIWAWTRSTLQDGGEAEEGESVRQGMGRAALAPPPLPADPSAASSQPDRAGNPQSLNEENAAAGGVAEILASTSSCSPSQTTPPHALPYSFPGVSLSSCLPQTLPRPSLDLKAQTLILKSGMCHRVCAGWGWGPVCKTTGL